MSEIMLMQGNPVKLENSINEIKLQLIELKKSFQPKEPAEYLTINEVKEMLNVNLCTIYNWRKTGKLKAYGIGKRVYFKRVEVNSAIVELKN